MRVINVPTTAITIYKYFEKAAYRLRLKKTNKLADPHLTEQFSKCYINSVLLKKI